jgi:hypothetical protein
MQAKNRTDVSSFELLVRFAIATMKVEELSRPEELKDTDRAVIDGIVIAIGFLLMELPEDLENTPIEFDLHKFYNDGINYLKKQVAMAMIKRSMN